MRCPIPSRLRPATFATALTLAAAVAVVPGHALALECTDFPAGARVNAVTTARQTDIALAYGPGDVLHAAWADARSGGGADVYSAHSTDGGLTFSTGQPVTPSSLPISGTPVIDANAAGMVAIAWAGLESDDLDVYVVRSTDGGQTFTGEVQANDWDLGDESFPALRLTPGGITYVAWISHLSEASPTVRLARALPGEAFEPSTLVNRGFVYSSCECCVIDVAVVGEDEVYVAFMANLDYVRDIYVSRSTDGGQSFADPVQVNDGHWYEPACPTSGPRLLVGPEGHLHIVWLDRHDNATLASVYYARSTDGGQTFLHRTPMNQPGDFVGHPHVAVTEDGTVHAVWEAVNDVTFVSNIEYAFSTDGGATFSVPCPLAGGSPYTQWLPAAAATPGGQLTVGWQDDRRGDDDVYVATVHAVMSVGESGAPRRAELSAAPNPFANSLRITLPVAAGTSAVRGRLRIYDAQGRMVRELAPVGPSLEWDGRDAGGARVAAGVYFLTFPSPGAALRVTRVD